MIQLLETNMVVEKFFHNLHLQLHHLLTVTVQHKVQQCPAKHV